MGADEVHARQTLLDMQDLLSRDPYEALGLIPSATASDIRNAFLSKTKQFHPARFGRMSSDIQRLANEVFLQLRAAHEQLARPAVKTPANRTTAGIPTLQQRPSGTGATPTLRPSPVPSASAVSRSGAMPPQGVPERSSGGGASGGNPSGGSGGYPAAGNSGGHATRPGTAGQPAPGAPRPGQPSPPAGQSGSGPRPAPTAARPAWPQTTPATRPGTMPTPIRPPTAPIRSIDPQPQGGARPTGGQPPQARPGSPAPAPQPAARPGQPVERELAPIFELFAQHQLAAARVALETLVARSPQSVRYQSLLAFAKGREAQLAGRVDEARVELHEALQLDPDLQLAKSALGELFTRRR